MLAIRDLRVVYANGVETLRNVSLAVQRGEIVALIGRSGAGKSTLLRCLNGLQPITSGTLRADLPAELKAAIKASLLSTPGDAEFIRATKRWYVDPSVEKGLPDLDAYYDPMRAMARLLDLDLRGLH